MFVSRRPAFIILVLIVLAEGLLFTIVSSSSNVINTNDTEKLHPTMVEIHGGGSKANISEKNPMNFRNSSNNFQRDDLSACTNCGLINPKEEQFLIIGGDIVDPPYKYPWMVRLVITAKKKWETLCGGSIINAYYILTAAHCLEDLKSPKGLHINFLTNTNSYARGPKVQDIIMHPEYNVRDLRNDIALVKLKKKIICDRFKNPICLPPSDLEIPIGTVFKVAGWGATKPGPKANPEELREGKVKLVNYATCAEYYRETGYLANFKYCFDGLEGNWQSTCEGDSGGPAFYEQNGKYYVIGVSSSSSKGCPVGHPFEFTAVPKYINWIKQVMESHSEKKHLFTQKGTEKMKKVQKTRGSKQKQM